MKAFMVLIVLAIGVPECVVRSDRREKRYLIYPFRGTKLQLIFGTGLPVPLEHIAATLGWILKSAYLLPGNASLYTDPYGLINERKIRSVDHMSRYQIYRKFEKYLSRLGIGDDCLRRAICETSRIPFSNQKLIGQVLKLFFIPSTSKDYPRSREDEEYHKAEEYGRMYENECIHFYSRCSLDIASYLSVTR